MKANLLLVIGLVFCLSCSGGKQDKPPVDLKAAIKSKVDVEISYSELGGVKTIPVKLNGVTMDMIFDTGCAGISLSLAELQTLAKNNKITNADVIGTSYSTIADGSIVENGVINLKEVQIGGEDGIVIKNVKASVTLNQEAPVLLGNGVLDEVASFEIDNFSKSIKFKRK